MLDERLAWFQQVDEVAIDPASMTAAHVAEIAGLLIHSHAGPCSARQRVAGSIKHPVAKV